MTTAGPPSPTPCGPIAACRLAAHPLSQAARRASCETRRDDDLEGEEPRPELAHPRFERLDDSSVRPIRARLGESEMVSMLDVALEQLSQNRRSRLNERRRARRVDDREAAVLEQLSHRAVRVKAQVRSVPEAGP